MQALEPAKHYFAAIITLLGASSKFEISCNLKNFRMRTRSCPGHGLSDLKIKCFR